MADSLDKFRTQFENLEKRDLKEFSFAAVEKHFKHFEACYEKCLKLEDELADTIPGARERGNNATDSKGLQRDPVFKKKYKEYDSSVDDIDKAEKTAFAQTIKTGALVADLEIIKKAIEKAFPKSKDMAVQLLIKLIDKKIAEMEKACALYDVRGKHKKMREYSSKFDKKIEAIIDRGPPPEKPEEIELPKELDTKELDKAEKTAKTMFGAIETARKNVDAIIEASVPFTPKADILAKKQEAIIDANLAKLRKFVKHYETLISKHVPKKPPRGDEKVADVNEFNEALVKLLKEADDIDKTSDAALKKARATVG